MKFHNNAKNYLHGLTKIPIRNIIGLDLISYGSEKGVFG
jgi:hypothetical protein